MRTIIAGSRSTSNPAALEAAMTSARLAGIIPTSIISGCARGADRLGECYALMHGLPLIQIPPNYSRYGPSAPFRRNLEMAQQADALVLVWDGQSPGSAHMLATAKAKGLQIYSHIVAQELDNTP